MKLNHAQPDGDRGLGGHRFKQRLQLFVIQTLAIQPGGVPADDHAFGPGAGHVRYDLFEVLPGTEAAMSVFPIPGHMGVGEQGQMMMRIDDGDGIDPSDPKFQDAQQACGSAFGPAGAKAGPGLSVGGSRIDGAKGGTGGMVIVGAGPAGSTAGGGSK